MDDKQEKRMTRKNKTQDNLPDIQPGKLGQYKPWHKGITLDDIINLKLTHPNLTLVQAAKLFNCSRNNICEHLSKANLKWQGIIEGLKEYKKHRADILAHKGMLCLNNITQDTVKEASVRDSAVTFAVLFDKERLERGLDNQSSVNNNIQISINFDPGMLPQSDGSKHLEKDNSVIMVDMGDTNTGGNSGGNSEGGK